VARALAPDGAAVFLAGRTLAPVRAVAEEISAGGGAAQAAQVDALDEQAIADHAAGVAAAAGRIDILFNAIGMEDVQGTPLRATCRRANSRPPRTTAPCCGGFPGSPK